MPIKFSENLSTLDARKDFLFNEKMFHSVINSKKYEKLKRKSKKMAKLKEILAPKLKKIAKTQVFGKSACVHGPPDCERRPGLSTSS